MRPIRGWVQNGPAVEPQVRFRRNGGGPGASLIEPGKSVTHFSLAYGVLIGGLALSLVVAWLLSGSGIMSLTSPGGTEPDAVGREFWLYLSAFTAWVTTLLLIPVFAAVWVRSRSTQAYAIWHAFWSAGLVAYLAHLAVSMFGFFGGDFAWMTRSTRVSAFWPGMILAVWWAVDVWLAKTRDDMGWVAVQRGLVHVLAFVLFVGGSAVKGELLTIRGIGVVLSVVAVAAALNWLFLRRKVSA